MTLRIHAEGQGPDLALLHGWGMNATVWRAVTTALAADYRVHAVEMPGYGVGDPAASADSLNEVIDALAAALPVSVRVCGWSLGGQVAMAWARRHPLQVTHLVLLATTPRFVCSDDWTCGMEQEEFESFVADADASLPRARLRFLTLQANGDAAARTVLRALRESVEQGGEPAGKAPAFGLALLRDIDLRVELARIDQPVLIMHGMNDALVPHSAGEHLAAALPRAEFESMGATGHALFATREDAVAKRIREFDGRY